MASLTAPKKYKLIKRKSPSLSPDCEESRGAVPDKHVTVAKKCNLPPIKGAQEDETTFLCRTRNRELFSLSPSRPRHNHEGHVLKRSIVGTVELYEKGRLGRNTRSQASLAASKRSTANHQSGRTSQRTMHRGEFLDLPTAEGALKTYRIERFTQQELDDFKMRSSAFSEEPPEELAGRSSLMRGRKESNPRQDDYKRTWEQIIRKQGERSGRQGESNLMNSIEAYNEKVQVLDHVSKAQPLDLTFGRNQWYYSLRFAPEDKRVRKFGVALTGQPEGMGLCIAMNKMRTENKVFFKSSSEAQLPAEKSPMRKLFKALPKGQKAMLEETLGKMSVMRDLTVYGKSKVQDEIAATERIPEEKRYRVVEHYVNELGEGEPDESHEYIEIN